MNLWLLIILVIVVAVFILASRKKDNQQVIKKTTPKEDTGKFFHHFTQVFIYLFILIIWGLKWIFGIFKTFIDWYKNKKDVAVIVPKPKGALWCPRCKTYFKKDHACFKH